MEKYVPFEKLSKKQQRERNAARRTTWSMSPVTRRKESKKIYSRRKAQNWKWNPDSVPFVLRLPPRRSRVETHGAQQGTGLR